MAQTKFKVEDGLLVRGQANVTGALKVEGPVTLLDNVVTSVTIGGNVTPTIDGTYQLGNTTHRWIIYADVINTNQPLTSSNAASFGNTLTLSGNLNFVANGNYVGNSVSQVLLYSSNAYVSDTLNVGNNTTQYLIINSSSFGARSNLISNGTAITLSSNSFGMFYIQHDNLTIAAGLPSTIIDEFNKTSFATAKYLIQARNNTTNDIYASEAIVTYHEQSNTVHFTEYGQTFNNTRFLNFTATTTSTAIRLVANGSATSVNLRAVRMAVIQ